jgi:hypothetical protein
MEEIGHRKTGKTLSPELCDLEFAAKSLRAKALSLVRSLRL